MSPRRFGAPLPQTKPDPQTNANARHSTFFAFSLTRLRAIMPHAHEQPTNPPEG
ncbi:hypothetical protein ARMA_2966 [Ardenticatena maritima]|uniref:Uncharacterized protein n=1 Tax=Ardenticatena maritima TaxID=872965 RepID=A0A0M8K9H2_9CHLR|nr:hypothetical protein ARMA_2966 [Ardenticatena maritima]